MQAFLRGSGAKNWSAKMERVKFWLSPHAIFRAGKTPKIPLFAPKPHGNACYAG